MQTFMPYPDFEQSARALDRQRLGSQRLEAYRLLLAVTGASDAWSHHPACTMWRGYEAALEAYYAAICREWIHRGYQNTMPVIVPRPPEMITLPQWATDPAVHEMYRAVLVGKLPEHYATLWPDVAAVGECQWTLMGVEKKGKSKRKAS